MLDSMVRYLRSTLRDIDEHASPRIKVSWLKWPQTSGVLCGPMVPKKLKTNYIGLRSDRPCCME
jgi:hypothetical protein